MYSHTKHDYTQHAINQITKDIQIHQVWISKESHLQNSALPIQCEVQDLLCDWLWTNGLYNFMREREKLLKTDNSNKSCPV